MNEVKQFTPMDLPLLRRVATKGLSLDIADALADEHPLESAMFGIVGLKGRGRPTYILRSQKMNYAAQMRLRDKYAQVTLLAPEPTDITPSWLALIDNMVQQAGKREAQFVTAEVPVDSVSFELLRQTGFSVYSRESLFAANGFADLDISLSEIEIRPIQDNDQQRLLSLYVQTMPRMVQQVLPAPSDGWQGLAVVYNQQVLGFIQVQHSRNAILLQPYFHPELYDMVLYIFAQALAQLPRRPIYIRLRAYQEWMKPTLMLDLHFTEQARFALMARHTVVRRANPSLSPLAALGQIIMIPNFEVASDLALRTQTATAVTPTELQN